MLYMQFTKRINPITNKKYFFRTLLVVQWLRLLTPNVGNPGSIPGQGRSHMPKLRSTQSNK